MAYRTKPLETSGLPTGIPNIIGNEAAERFSFYGMRAILYTFLTQHMLTRAGEPDFLNPADATGVVHLFMVGVYLTPLIGGLVADLFLGKYHTIIAFSLVYCVGHFVLAIDDTRMGMYVGLSLISFGAGGIKPCVSAHVGDQFGERNAHWLPKIYGWFYFAINFGSFFSQLLTPYLLKAYGPKVAFGVPGLLMLLATLVFWMGRNYFAHVPPGGVGFLRTVVSREGMRATGRLLVVYAFVALFWSLYDQTASRWIEQAESLDRTVDVTWLRMGKWTVHEAQIQAVNPLLILIYIPIFNNLLYPFLERFVRLTPLRKMSCGMFLTAFSFMIPYWVEKWLAAGGPDTPPPSMYWQILAYIILTAAEVLVSTTGLEFSYTQAPNAMKSFVMSLWFLAVASGNLFTAVINFWIGQEEGGLVLEGADYYWFFVRLMFIAAVLFVIVAQFYRGETYLHEAE